MEPLSILLGIGVVAKLLSMQKAKSAAAAPTATAQATGARSGAPTAQMTIIEELLGGGTTSPVAGGSAAPPCKSCGSTVAVPAPPAIQPTAAPVVVAPSVSPVAPAVSPVAPAEQISSILGGYSEYSGSGRALAYY